MPAPAAILLAFANDWVDDKRHLRSLLDESKAIAEAMAPLVDAGLLGMPPPIHNATVDDVIRTFRVRRYRDRIRVFHFGGHASGSSLLFEDEVGGPTEAQASGLAGYLGRQTGLVLVFLNGCCTEPQVRQLRQAGVKAVVATTSAIQDKVAAEFAKAFYAELAARSLRDAFDTAVQTIRMSLGDNPRAVTRDVAVTRHVVPHDTPEPPAWPWIIDCDPAFEAWSLGSELAAEARRTRRRRILLAMAAMSLLLVTPLAVSAEARRTTCRVPGLRSLCAVVGIGPTRAEQALWDDARAQRSGDGLRAYLRAYPRGVYADEALARERGCTVERDETLGPARDVRLPLTVPRGDPSPTEEAAHRDAESRGNRDAADACGPYKTYTTKFELVTVIAEPREWNCLKAEHGFACGFHGEAVCRIRDRIQTDHERCH